MTIDPPSSGQLEPGATLRDRYIDLLKHAVAHTLYGQTASLVNRPSGARKTLKRLAFDRLAHRGIALVRLRDAKAARETGADWPLFGQTMIGHARLENIRVCVERVLADDVPGDFIETGAWRGGASIFMRGILQAHEVSDRKVYVADSFAGMPRPDGRYPLDHGSRAHLEEQVAVSLDMVQENFRRYGLLDEQVQFLEGWFRDTLPSVRGRTWAIVRLDGDMYQSTMDALENLYDDLSPGGYLIVDDYSLHPCREAVMAFRQERQIGDPIHEIDWTGVYWRKDEKSFTAREGSTSA
jgi:hypothetical protein